MQPNELLKSLIEFVPQFKAYWDGPDNYFRSDARTQTLHGVFSAFSIFCLGKDGELTNYQRKQIGEFVSDCMRKRGTDLDNAAATCFIENIADDLFANKLRPHLSGEALSYLKEWSG